MTHFNHEWDTTKTPAIPVSVGDRYYAQDLNDDFNYLKHLPYEVFLQGRSRGVMITPNDTWNNDTNSLTLSGGFGTVLQDCIELDPDEDFVIPPKTHSSPRYERIPFVDTVLILPNDGVMHYIVATPTKRSLLQRTKALFAEQYTSRVRYDGIITIQDTAPTAGQILVGLCHDKEYCLLTDTNPDQCKDNIILKKWFGQSKITHDFVTALQSYYNTSTFSIETDILIETVSGSNGVSDGKFNNCTITIGTINDTHGIENGDFNNCTITIGTINGSRVHGIENGDFKNCIIIIDNIKMSVAFGIQNGNFNNCNITINKINDSNVGIYGGNFNNCNITINTINGDITSVYGISGDTFNNCVIVIDKVITGSVGTTTAINNHSSITLCYTLISCSAVTNLNNTSGKLNILNDTVLHAS